MKKLLLVVLLCIASSIASAQSIKQEARDEQVKTELIALVNKYHDAIAKKDAVIIKRLLADDFGETSLGADNANTKQIVLYVNPMSTTFEISELEYSTVTLHKNLAIVTGISKIKGTANNQTNEDDSIVTTVCVKREGQWRIVASHGNNLTLLRQQARN